MTKTVNDFVKFDNPRSLFPLSSTKRYIELGGEKLREFIYESIFDANNKAISFTTCPIAYALKDKLHLRRMLLLDPLASFYIYNFLLENWKLLKPQKNSNRRYFGYTFKSGKPLNPFTLA